MKAKLIKLFNMALNFYKSRILPSQEQSPLANKILISLLGRQSQEQEGIVLTQVDWLITNHEGLETETVIGGDLSRLQPEEQDAIRVIVPAETVLLTEATLPRLSAYRLQQALPYALEEQVLEEPELLHFAAGPYQQSSATIGSNESGLNLPVAVIKKQVMAEWLKLLQKTGVQPDLITSAVFSLPYSENHWQLLITQGQATVRTGLYSGFSSELQNLETLLSLRLGEEEKKPEKLIIYHELNQDFSFNSLTLPTAKLALTPKQMLELQASALEKGPTLNLLQAPYSSVKKLKIPEKNKQAWRLAALAFSFWLGLLFLTKLGSLFILSYEHHHLQNLVAETYQFHFPQAKSMLDPKAKLEAKLKTALAQSEKNQFFQWLGAIAKSASSLRLQSLTYQNQQLSLELVASSYSSLDQFMLALKAEGIEVRQQSATMLGSQVRAVLLIEGKSA